MLRICNENATSQNLCNAVKAVFKGKFMAVNAYLKKGKRTQNFIT